MKTIVMPTSGENLTIDIPSSWTTTVCSPERYPVLTNEQVAACFNSPIRSPTLQKLAVGKKRAAVVVEDITRPMRVDRILPHVLKELEDAGIRRKDISIVSALGCHRPQSGPDFRRKLGNRIVDHYRTINPSLHDELSYMGDTSRGTPIWINSLVAKADVKVGVGGILPHPNAGFGGGGKTVLPGVCGLETISRHHQKLIDTTKRIGDVEGNSFREDLEEAARLIKLDFVANAVMGIERDIVGLCVGDMIAAHRAAIAEARRAYHVEAPSDAEVVIINAYPEDYDLIQSTKALSKGMAIKSAAIRGKVLLVTSCPDGVGYHALYGAGGRGHSGFKQRRELQCRDYDIMVASPGIGSVEMREVFPESVSWFESAVSAVSKLEERLPKARANIFPYGGISIVGGSFS